MPIKLDSKLIDVLKATAAEARKRMQRWQTLEHFLYVVVRDGAAVTLLDACGCDSAHLLEELTEYLELQTELAGQAVTAPKAEDAYDRTLQRAGMHALSSNQTQVDIGQVLVQLLREEKSYAAMLMRAEGVERLELMRYLSHGHPGPFPPPPDLHPRFEHATVTLHNDDYTPMDFVVFVLQTIFEQSEAEATARMQQIHQSGRSILGIYRVAVAHDKVAQVHTEATQAGFPLRATLAGSSGS